ncbi:MAG TPA: hypothetical protein VGI14_18095 [Casimicrobiaceae bacterium]|jgi:hypothetical protein
MTDERDLHDPALDTAWRKHLREEPPEPLDRTVLAAAHRAVQSGPRAADAPAPSRWRAWVPLAVAATLGAIAFGVVQLMPHEADDTNAVTSDMPVATLRKEAAPASEPGPPPAVTDQVQSAAPAASSPTASEEREAARKDTPKIAAKAERAREQEQRRQIAAAPEPQPFAPTERDKLDARAAQAPAPAASPAAPAPAAPAPAPPSSALSDATPPAAPGAAPARPLLPEGLARNGIAVDRAAAVARAQSEPGKTATARTPDDFVREIERLRGEGRDADAALALSAFRAAFTDADSRLPESLRGWARTVAQP